MEKDGTVTLSVKENLEALLSPLGSVESGVAHVLHRNGLGKVNRTAVDRRRLEEQARVCGFPSGSDESN